MITPATSPPSHRLRSPDRDHRDSRAERPMRATLPAQWVRASAVIEGCVDVFCTLSGAKCTREPPIFSYDNTYARPIEGIMDIKVRVRSILTHITCLLDELGIAESANISPRTVCCGGVRLPSRAGATGRDVTAPAAAAALAAAFPHLRSSPAPWCRVAVSM